MFEHAYHGYMKYAYPYDELRPLTCDGVDTWGRYILVLYSEIILIIYALLILFVISSLFIVIHYR